MIKMRVTQDEARELIRKIPHKSCQKSAPNCWAEGGTSGVTAQSICWLYCWAKTGMNSVDAASQSKHAFNQIFNRSYEWFDARVPHEWARDARYASSHIEPELMNMLAR